MSYEYRVEFASPYNDYVHYSEAVDDPRNLPSSAPRSEETHEYVKGIQIREVTTWSETMLLKEDVNASNSASSPEGSGR